MRIGVTVEAAGESEDLLVDCDDATTVEELERSLHLHLGRPVRLPGRRREPACRTVVNGARLGGGGRSRSPRQASWQLHVVSGPDSGGVWDLAIGDHVVGRSGGICWNDPAVSRRHLALRVSSTVEVTDLGSTHGTRLDGRRCLSGDQVTWPLGGTLEIGNSVAVLREPLPADGLWEEAGPGWRRLQRPPRLQTRPEAQILEMPEPPPKLEKRGLPALALGVPLVMGVGIALALRRPEYLLFAAVSPMMVVANHLTARFGTARGHAGLTAAHSEKLEEAEQRVADALRAEERRLRDGQPDAATTLLTALLPGRRLWERRPGDSDFLRLRVGSADQPSCVRVSGGDPTDRVVRLAPQCVDLATASVVGIAGDPAVADGVLRWMVAQLAAHHAPRDLSLVFLGLDAHEDWRWMRWLPHLRSGIDVDGEVAAGTDRAGIGRRVSELRDLIRLRRRTTGPTPPHFSTVVVVVRVYADVCRVVDLQDLVDEGPGVGVHILCTAFVDSELPDHARAVVSTSSARAAYGVLTEEGHRVESVLLEQVSPRWAERFARALAPFQDSSGDARAAVPDRVRLVDLLDSQPHANEIRARWSANPRSTSVMLGASAHGVLPVDLAVDGPHALVAGMTGSGKTELLQSLIASLALGNHPRWLNFVLIDYKGDSAFLDCARLPHTVGKVTDLSPALVQRALISLRAELERRKALLADVAVIDVDAYYEVWMREPHRPPLPRLVLVIDEFAELVKELPDFIDGLVSIAQLGRSLGVHLILATQRPNGVLSPAIRANANIRIALRVADAADSVDVLGASDASLIRADQQGRAYLRLGAQPATEFQAARVAVATSPREQVVQRIPVITPLSRGAIDEGSLPSSSGVELLSDLAMVVDSVRDAAEGEPSSRRPWLDPLPSRLPWSCREQAPMARRLQLPFGLSDLPALQRQDTASFDLARDGHLFFIGAPRSGRSQALLVLAAAIAELTDPADLHLYGLDCGAGALRALASMPHSGAVVARHETERVRRLLARLTDELDQRQSAAARDSEDRSPPRLVLMVDRWEAFVGTFAEFSDQLDAVMRLLREGAGVGIHLVITGDRSLLTNSRMSVVTEAKYVLRLGEKGDYALAGLNARQISADMPPGRCFGPGMRETQVFLLDVEPTCGPRGPGPRPFRIDPLPTRIGVAEALALLPETASRPAPIVGVGGDELRAFAPDLSLSTCFAVIGPPRSGRSSVLVGAVESAVLTGAEVVVVAPRPSPLRQVEGRPGVLAVVAGGTARADVDTVLTQRSDGPLVLVIDDADELDTALDGVLLSAARGQLPGVFLMVAGTAEGMGYGLRGWQAEVRKGSQGLLLSPRGLGDGQLIGATLTREMVGRAIHPGTGLLRTAGATLTSVATLAPTTAR